MRNIFLSLVILMLTASFSLAQEMEEFEQQWNAAESKEAKLTLARDAIATATDLDEIRSIQDTWEEYNRDSALEFFIVRADEHRTAENLYLLGRLQDDPSESISLARQSIEADPKFSYAYRLLVVTYMNNLFDADEDSEHYATLKASFESDFLLMNQIRDYLPDDGGSWGLLYEAQLYRKDYTEQLECLARGKEMGERWAGVQGFTNAYVGLGDYAVALAKLDELLDERIADDRLEREMREEMRLYRYFTALEQVGAWDEAIRYFKSYDGEEFASSAKIYLASAYLNSGKENKAIKALEQAVEFGYDTVSELTDYGDFDDLMDHKKWDDIIAGVKQNRIDNAPERRAELLATRIDLAAPDLSLRAVDGSEMTIADFRGKVVVIDFWATWCGPCRMAMPEIDEFTEDYSDKDVVVISLNVWENVPEKAKAFMIDNEYDMRLMWASGDAKPTDLYEVTGIPTLIVIDKEGVIRYKEVGFEEGLREKLGWFADDLL